MTEEPGSSEPPIERRLHVLVVDDEPMVREALIRVLSADGYETSWAANGNSALRQMRSEHPDVVILDMLLGPGGPDGWSVLRQKVSEETIRGIPVIILTGMPTVDVHSGASAIDRAISGALLILGKPLDLAALRQAIRLLANC